jgi:hypothetical protein
MSGCSKEISHEIKNDLRAANLTHLGYSIINMVGFVGNVLLYYHLYYFSHTLQARRLSRLLPVRADQRSNWLLQSMFFYATDIFAYWYPYHVTAEVQCSFSTTNSQFELTQLGVVNWKKTQLLVFHSNTLKTGYNYPQSSWGSCVILYKGKLRRHGPA